MVDMESSFVERMQKLADFVPAMVSEIKKDLKREHLKKSPQAVRRWFGNRPVIRLTPDEMIIGYGNAIAGGDEDVAETVASRWIMNHSELYRFFESELSRINPNFESIEVLTEEDATSLAEKGYARFPKMEVYLFSILNSVAFSGEWLAKLKGAALEELKEASSE